MFSLICIEIIKNIVGPIFFEALFSFGWYYKQQIVCMYGLGREKSNLLIFQFLACSVGNCPSSSSISVVKPTLGC